MMLSSETSERQGAARKRPILFRALRKGLLGVCGRPSPGRSQGITMLMDDGSGPRKPGRIAMPDPFAPESKPCAQGL